MNFSTAATDNQPHIKIYPGLARVAMAAGWSRDCRWWHILRAVASRRDGWQWFTVEDVVDIFGRYGLSRRQAYDLFAAGNGVFFEVNRARGVVALVGLQRVCEALQCAAGRPVALPINQVSGRLTAWRSAVYALGFAVKARNISRQRLQDETGASPSTQRRYEAQTGVTVEALFEFAADGVTTSIPDGAPWWFTTHNGIAGVTWQTVNKYTLHTETRSITPARCRRGMSRKIRCSPANGDGMHRRKHFFDKMPHKQPQTAYGVLDNGSVFDYHSAAGKRVAGPVYVRVPSLPEYSNLPEQTKNWYNSFA